MNPTKFWIGVVSLDHVKRGVAGSFAQVCHGKAAPLRRMCRGDVMFYYSPRTSMNRGESIQSFTAVGRIVSESPYSFVMRADFVPYRVDVAWMSCRTAAIAPLLADLSFITDIRRWGYPFKRGHFEISPADARRIAQAMNVDIDLNDFAIESTTQNEQENEQGQFPF